MKGPVVHPQVVAESADVRHVAQVVADLLQDSADGVA